MAARDIISRLTVTQVLPGRVVCSAPMPAHDGSGTHTLLSPVLLLGEIERTGTGMADLNTTEIIPGDTIVRYKNGTHEHFPRPRVVAPASPMAATPPKPSPKPI